MLFLVNSKFLNIHLRSSMHLFSDLESLLRSETPDLLIIATPSGIHYKNAKLALNRGCNVLIEKPITLKVNEANELYNLATCLL